MAKTEDAKKELSIDEKFSLMLDVLAQQRNSGIDADALREILAETQKSAANAMHKTLYRSNSEHPHISAFSKPLGELADPSVTLPFEVFYNGYPCHMFPETEHWREKELMAQLKPGEYTVLRKDASKMAITVKGEKDADGKLTKVLVEFPVSREEKGLVPPKSVVLYQLVYTDRPLKRAFMEAMQEHLTHTLGDVAV